MSDNTSPGTERQGTDSWEQLRQASDPKQFGAAWLHLQCQMLNVEITQGVVVLGKEGQGAFVPVAVWPAGSLGTPHLTAAVEAAINQKATVIKAHQQRHVIACPLTADAALCGVAAIETAACSEQELQQLAARLEWGTAWLEVLVHRNRYTAADRLVTVLNLVATSLHYERFQAAATAAATELAAELKCERVAIGFMQGKHSRIEALSHSATFNRKSNILRGIEAAMDEAIDQQATVVYPPTTDGPLQVTRAHSELAEKQSSGAVCSIPFAEGSHMLGAITLEKPSGECFNAATLALCEHAATLLGPVLDVKRRDDRWLLRKAADSLHTQAQHLVGPRHTALKLATIGTVCLALFLLFARGEYRVTADARLEGVIQRSIAAPLAGFISEANARAGDVVSKGDILFELDDRDLRLERLKWAGQKSQYSREHSEALAEHDRARANILSAQIEQATAQIALIEEQLQRIKVVAPFDSFVVSGDLSQSLGAPVERGDILFEVAPLNAYRVILKVDERDISDVTPGQTGHLALTGLPGVALPIEVTLVTPVATAEEGRNYFRVEASLDDDSAATLRPGMQGAGKIAVEQRRLVWIWSHKIIQWWRMFLWSWWP
jgi:RND family efflux transporter MFP subunit